MTGVASKGFESYILADPQEPKADSEHPIWVTYGGRARSGAIYCCPGEGGSGERPDVLRIDDIDLPMIDSPAFEAFRKAMTRRPQALARITAIGTFFFDQDAGRGGGYGHFGCCSLLVFQQVETFTPVTRPDGVSVVVAKPSRQETEADDHRDQDRQQHDPQ